MNTDFDLKMAYHMGYEDALAKRMPEPSKATVLGRGTCRIDYHFGEWYCTGCGKMVGTSDPTSELNVDGNFIELWSYCPNCGRKVEP